MTTNSCWEEAADFVAQGEIKRAIELCERDACARVVECQRFLGWQYYKRDEFEQALAWFRRGVEQGDAECCYGLGAVEFVRRDFDSASRHYQRAAELGYMRAYHWLGYMCQYGLGVPRDMGRAIDFYRSGAAHGYLIAERALITISLREPGVLSKLRNYTRLLALLMKSAIIAYRDGSDPRLADVPNAFASRKSRVESR